MNYSSEAVERAVHELSKLPGIGRKSAQRLVFFMLKVPDEEVRALAQALADLHDKVRYCSRCFNITEEDPCPICSDEMRDRRLICVVEEANDVVALEKTGEFKGLYHVLGGALSPLDGIGPDDLKIKALLGRLTDEVEEIILATNPNTEGEATALYLARLLKPMQLRISRIARGIPVGADIEYADEMTLSRAMAGRVLL
ncbi:MAG TPA: recombination mediator RecR [bacterium]|nr:recombination mediator RecR [bacterium]HOC88810.1 recombination mediator RecR [bacterium]HOZ21277.1 recombination mediator RecR [bacterium]